MIAREAVALAQGLGGAVKSAWNASVAAFQNESLADMALKTIEGLNPAAGEGGGLLASAGVKLIGVAQGARAIAEPVYKTTKQAQAAAEALGFVRINETVHDGQAVFRRGKDFITRDLDGHNGGAWKMADSVKNLGSKETRAGTFDINLNRIGD
ncbi:hypothetical protein GCM10023165_34430 [Variovorax defluvii]|uniref:Novel toxin 21 domain-containing protein n=1 Tax=Variovorax defluvii TaxID=913761 RepID=A0ABP8I041_9BURK